ncbi:MAG: cobalamin-dependent protein [Candidatus Pacearchaeota archaeon]|jgi:radical SAM superfamily enzyme YgiQ (UPF0313 family)
MAKIYFWNSIATRKRSPSDGFIENGLNILKTFLEENNHEVEVIDWQKNDFYKKISPGLLLKLNRISTGIIFGLGKRNKLLAKLYFPIFNSLQNMVSSIQKRKMIKYLESLGDEIIKKKVKILGIKVWYGESFVWSKYLVDYIRTKDPSILTIGGGFHVTLYEEDFLKYSNFDYGVVTEGEKPLQIILDIVDKYKENWDKNKVMDEIYKKIRSGILKNMIFRNKEIIKKTSRYPPLINEKKIPNYDKNALDGKLKIHVIVDSYGCPWGKCNFCVHSHFQKGYFPRKIDNIIEELIVMKNKGIGLFRFAGSETPPSFGANIAKKIIQKKLNIRYSIGCRAVKDISKSDAIYKKVVKDFKIMIKSGLRAIFIGGEAAIDSINEKIMNKGVTRDDIVYTIKAFKEAKKTLSIEAYVSLALIYPAPLKDNITLSQLYKENLKLVEDSLPDSVIVSPSTPFKNTTWFNNCKEYNFELPEDFIEKMMSYEYILYKPPTLWPKLGNVKFAGLDFMTFLEECEKLRKAIELKGIPADLTDEYFLMIDSAGYKGKEGLIRFKKDTSIDLVSGDYSNIEKIRESTNRFSEELTRTKL